MRFNIVGADRDTGQNIEMKIDADDESAAQEVAHRKGIMVSGISPALAIRPNVIPAPLAHPLEQGHCRGAPVVNIAIPRRGNSLGVASLILGILGFFICWIPIVNLLGVPLSGLGLLLGLIGLLVAVTRRGASIGYPIAGSAVCGLALFIAIAMTGAFVTGLKTAGDKFVREAERRNATNQRVVPPAVTNSIADKAPKPATTHAAEAAPLSRPPVVTPPPKKPEIGWASAETPVKQGDVQVRVKAVRVGKVPLKASYGEGTGQSQDALLMIEIEVTNLSETKKLNYRTWGGSAMSFGNRTALTDNFDNRYKSVNFGLGNEVVGAVESESIYPAKAITDVLVFEQPISKVEYLNIELPAEQFGGEGMLRIRIPVSMIQK